jgi:isopenicillin N synthase-like dioxygenase
VCRDIVKEYSEATQQVANTIFELLAEGLGLQSQQFVEALGGPQDIDYVMMMAYYPRCPQPELALGLIGHTDPNLITLLIQDELGLEVKKDGLWIPVVPASNSFVVNIGDSIQVLHFLPRCRNGKTVWPNFRII